MVFNRTEYDAALAIVKASLDQPALKGLFQPELVDPRNMTIYPWDMIAIFAALVGCCFGANHEDDVSTVM